MDERTGIPAVEIVSMSARPSLEVLDAQYDRESLCSAAFEEHQIPETRGYDVQRREGCWENADVISMSRGLVCDIEGVLVDILNVLENAAGSGTVGLRRLINSGSQVGATDLDALYVECTLVQNKRLMFIRHTI